MRRSPSPSRAFSTVWSSWSRSGKERVFSVPVEVRSGSSSSRFSRREVAASFSPIRNRTQKVGDPNNLGHFFMAIDPKAFRDEGQFENDLDDVIDVLRGAKRADPAQPVLIPGDPEHASIETRTRSGIPLPDDLVALLRAIAQRAGARFMLD